MDFLQAKEHLLQKGITQEDNKVRIVLTSITATYYGLLADDHGDFVAVVREHGKEVLYSYHPSQLRKAEW